jgi:hypothetical protein
MMFIMFDEGEDYLNIRGWPLTVYFMLSTRYIDPSGSGTQHTETDTLAGSGHGGEITGTGYVRLSQSTPISVSGEIDFASMTWSTGVNTDWSNNVRSLVATTSADNSGVMLCAWDVNSGAARDMSKASTTEQVTPVYVLQA